MNIIQDPLPVNQTSENNEKDVGRLEPHAKQSGDNNVDAFNVPSASSSVILGYIYWPY